MKRALTLLTIVLFSVTGAFITVEIGFRLINPQTTINDIVLPYDFHCFIPGKNYPLALKPNSSCLLKSTANQFPDVMIKTNKLGMRNPEIVSPKPAGTIRILIVGDSYVTGWGVEEQESFPRLVEAKLRMRHPDKLIEIINAGLPGSGPSYYYLFLKDHIAALQPDIVIIGFLPQNDIVTNLYYSHWDEVDSKGLPTKVGSTLAIASPRGNIISSGLPLKFRIPILRYSHAFAAAMDVLHPENSGQEPQEKSAINIPACLYKRDCHKLDDAKARAKKLFSGIKALTEANGSDLEFVFIPSELQIDRKARLKYGIIVPLLPSDKEYPYEEFKTFFNEQSLRYLDLRPTLKEHAGEKLYFTEDDHWTPLGHSIAAEAIASELSAHIADIRIK